MHFCDGSLMRACVGGSVGVLHPVFKAVSLIIQALTALGNTYSKS